MYIYIGCTTNEKFIRMRKFNDSQLKIFLKSSNDQRIYNAKFLKSLSVKQSLSKLYICLYLKILTKISKTNKGQLIKSTPGKYS